MLSRTEAIFDINLLKIQVYINWWKAYLNNVYFIKFEEKKRLHYIPQVRLYLHMIGGENC